MRNGLLRKHSLAILVGLLILALNSWPSISAAKQLSEKDKARLFSLAHEISSKVDASKLRLLRDAKDERTPVYLSLQSILQAYKRKSNGEIRYLYVVRQVNNKYIYVLDAEPIGNEDHTTIGDLFDINSYPKAKDGFERPSIDDAPTYDSDLKIFVISLYTPIKDNANNTIAVLGMDVRLKG